MIYHFGNFDDPTQSGFLVIPKSTFGNLCKPIHDVTIVTVSSDPFNFEIAERKGENYKKLNISRMKKVF